MKQHALIQGTEVRVCAEKDGNSLRRVAFSGGRGYADPMEYEHEWDRDLLGLNDRGEKDDMDKPDDVTKMLKERSMYGWELVSVVRNEGNEDAFDLFWKKPVSISGQMAMGRAL